MRQKRKTIPKKIEREILFRNQSACCICGKPNIQIHHIDGNEENNALSNLCVLCIEHHALASSRSSMTKGLSPDLLRKYKSEWEGYIARKRRQLIEKKPKNKFGEEMIRFEIKKAAYNLPTKKTKKEVEELIDFLYNIHIFEGFTFEIMKNLNYISWFLPNKQIGYIASRIYEFFWHFLEPDEVKMKRSDEKDLNEAVNLLGGYATCVLIIEPNKENLKSICNGLLNLFKISAIYKKKQIGLEIRKEFEKIKKEVTTEIRNKKKRKIITNLVENFEKDINTIWKKSKRFSIMPSNELLILEG